MIDKILDRLMTAMFVVILVFIVLAIFWIVQDIPFLTNPPTGAC